MDLFEKFDEQFSAILVNSPWEALRRRAGQAVAELSELPIAGLASRKCHIYFRTSNPRLPDSLNLIEAWGFTYRISLPLVAVNAQGELLGHDAGPYFRDGGDLLLVADKSKSRRSSRRDDNLWVPALTAVTRVLPRAIYQFIESRSKGPYLELFAHVAHRGWRHWNYRDATQYRAPPQRRQAVRLRRRK